MKADDPGYLLEVPYTGDFYEHLSPAWMTYIARINGVSSPRLDDSFDWCELGCGQGRTAALLAAVFPQGRFHACDINSGHVRAAKALRERAGLHNVEFHLASVAEMLERGTGPFDFIVLHGLYSWVPDNVRQEITAFASSRLKPGGLMMVSYNALPGWAHLEPLRRWLNREAQRVSGPLIERAQTAFLETQRLAKSGAKYFSMHPALENHLDELSKKDIRYVIHEYLTPHHRAFYCDEVADAFSSADLDFVGTMNPADNYTELSVPAAFQGSLRQCEDRLATEAFRDFVFNTPFRQDLFVRRGGGVRSNAETSEFPGLAFTLADLPERLPLKENRGGVAFDLTTRREAVAELHATLAEGPVDATRLTAAAGPGRDSDASRLIEELVVAGHLVPTSPLRSAAGWTPAHDAILDLALRERSPRVPLPASHQCSVRYFDPVEATLMATLGTCRDENEAGTHVTRRLREAEHPVMRQSALASPEPATDDDLRTFARVWWRQTNPPDSDGRRRLRMFGLLP